MCVGDLLLLVVHGAHVIWLVVKQPSEKYELGWVYIPNWMESHKIAWFQTTNQSG